MKKYLPYANYLAAGAGVAAALLYKWALSAGTDDKGLYPAAHPGWIGYLVVMVAAIVLFFLMTRSCGKNGSWNANFPGGILPVLGQLAAACALVLYGIPRLAPGEVMHFASGMLALGSAVALAAVSIRQLQQKSVPSSLFALPCLFFALQLFLLGKQYGTETQLLGYLPQFAACAASSLASYELIGFGVEDGNREKSLFWSLTAAALCFAAMSSQWMFAALGLWHLLGHCSLAEPIVIQEETTEEAAEEETEL